MRLQQTVGVTFIIVTHDQDEAISMADRVAVMEVGKVRQVAQPAATIQNDSRTKARVEAGEQMWASWIPGDTLILAD